VVIGWTTGFTLVPTKVPGTNHKPEKNQMFTGTCWPGALVAILLL